MRRKLFIRNTFRALGNPLQLAFRTLPEDFFEGNRVGTFGNVARQLTLSLGARLMADTSSLNLMDLLDRFQTDDKRKNVGKGCRKNKVWVAGALQRGG